MTPKTCSDLLQWAAIEVVPAQLATARHRDRPLSRGADVQDLNDLELIAMRERDASIEREAWAKVASAIAGVVDAVSEYPRLWSYGDGYGGAVISDVYAAFQAAGYQTSPPPRTAAERAAKRTLPADLRARVFARDGLTCQHCGTTETLTVDHIVAQANGGTDDLDNLQTLCKSCNSKKGKR